MKTKSRFCLLAALLCFISNSGQATRLAPSELQGSQVVLDWPEFIRLWEEAHKPPVKPPEPAPPVDYILSRSHYSGVVRPRATEIQASFELNILSSENWVSIPFLPAALGLKEAALDGKAVAVAQEGGYHTLILKGAGRRRLSVAFSIATPDKDGEPRLDFPVTKTAMTLLTLTFPKPNLKVTVHPAQVLSAKSQEGKTTVQAILSPTENIQVLWQRKILPSEALPPKIYSHLEELISVEESAIKIRAEFTYSILHGGVDELRLRIPKSVTVLSVSGDAIQDWKTIDEKNETGLLILLNQKRKGSQRITLLAEAPLSDAPMIEIPMLRTLGTAREEGFVGVEAKSGVEVSIHEVRNLRQIDVKELPQNLWSLASHPLLYGFAHSQRGPFLALGIKRHEDVPVLTSTVDSANAVTLLTRDGQWVTRASFQVRNHLKQFIAMKLPKGAQIWSAFVCGQPVKPSKDKEGQILIPLQKSGPGFQQEAFSVEIIYHIQERPLSFAGRRNVSLPVVDLPVSQMLWSVYLPEEYRFLHFGGNMDKERGARGLYPVLYEGTRADTYPPNALAEAPAMVVEKKAMAIGEKMMGMGARLRTLPGYATESLRRQAEMEFRAEDTAGASLENHVLPVAFRIPQAGRLYRFGKIMVTGSTPTLQTRYVSLEVIRVFKAMGVVIALAWLYLIRRQFVAAIRRIAKILEQAAQRIGPIYQWLSRTRITSQTS